MLRLGALLALVAAALTPGCAIVFDREQYTGGDGGAPLDAPALDALDGAGLDGEGVDAAVLDEAGPADAALDAPPVDASPMAPGWPVCGDGLAVALTEPGGAIRTASSAFVSAMLGSTAGAFEVGNVSDIEIPSGSAPLADGIAHVGIAYHRSANQIVVAAATIAGELRVHRMDRASTTWIDASAPVPVTWADAMPPTSIVGIDIRERGGVLGLVVAGSDGRVGTMGWHCSIGTMVDCTTRVVFDTPGLAPYGAAVVANGTGIERVLVANAADGFHVWREFDPANVSAGAAFTPGGRVLGNEGPFVLVEADMIDPWVVSIGETSGYAFGQLGVMRGPMGLTSRSTGQLLLQGVWDAGMASSSLFARGADCDNTGCTCPTVSSCSDATGYTSLAIGGDRVMALDAHAVSDTARLIVVGTRQAGFGTEVRLFAHDDTLGFVDVLTDATDVTLGSGRIGTEYTGVLSDVRSVVVSEGDGMVDVFAVVPVELTEPGSIRTTRAYVSALRICGTP